MPLENKICLSIVKIKAAFEKNFNIKSKALKYIIPLILCFLICLSSILLFIDITRGFKNKELDNFDAQVSEYIQDFRSEALSDFFIAVTNIGDTEGYVIITLILSAIFFLGFKNWKYPLQVTFVLLLSFAINSILKQLIDRQRPTENLMIEVYTLSFPSGHAMCAMAFYGFLIYISWQDLKNKWLKVLLTLVLTFIILSIGISRIYLGVHYPSDVVAGYVAGIFWIAFCVFAYHIFSIFRRKEIQ